MNVFKFLGSRYINKRRRNVLIVFFSALVIFGLLSLLVLFRPIAGMSLINLDKRLAEVGIELYDNNELTEGSSSLKVSPLDNATETVFYDVVPLVNEIIVNDGQYESNNVIGYSFYLKNLSEEAVDITFKLSTVDGNAKLLDGVIAHLIKTRLDDNEVVSESYFISDNSLSYINENKENMHPLYRDTSFDSFDTLYSTGSFISNEVYRYTLIVWVDGWLTTAKHKNTSLELTLLFTIDDEE